MDDLYVVDKIDEHRSICISTLAKTTIYNSKIENLGDDHGYFIYEVDERPILGGIIVLAKAASEEAALKLIELWTSSKRAA